MRRLKPERSKKRARDSRAFSDFNAYYDTRSFSVLTINDLGAFYSEQNLRYAVHESVPLDLTIQWVTRSPGGNDALRFGVRWLNFESTEPR